jgi:alpha-1,2-mannosyltransferase
MSNLTDRYNKTSIITRWLICIISLCALSVLTLYFINVEVKYVAVDYNKIQFPDIAVDKTIKPSTADVNQKPLTGYEYVLDKLIYKERPVVGDSWIAMVGALDFMQKHPGQPVYEAFFKKGIKFQYPLSSLLIFDLPHRLTGASFSFITYCLNILSVISVFAFAFICTKILLGVLKKPELQILNPSPNPTTLQYILLLLLTGLFYPIIHSCKLGQIQTILTLLASIVILCWQYNKKILAGIILGFVCIVKPQLALLFFWALIRRQWKMIIAGAITMTILLLISFQLYGFSANLHYLQILSFLSHHGESYYQNQSINGLLNRLLFNGQNLTWDGAFPPYLSVVYGITFVSSLIFMISGLFWNYKAKEPGVIDLCIMMLCTTIASPIAWDHHYAIILPIFMVLSPYALHFYADKKWMLFILSIGYLLVSIKIEFVKLFANTHLNILQSYLFFGACIILLFLFIIAAKIKKGSFQK